MIGLALAVTQSLRYGPVNIVGRGRLPQTGQGFFFEVRRGVLVELNTKRANQIAETAERRSANQSPAARYQSF